MNKVYQAPTMAQAIAAVKKDLGRDAVIHKTRSVRKGGFLGLIGGQPMWEIVASAGGDVPHRPIRGQYIGSAEPAEQIQPSPTVAKSASRAGAIAIEPAPRPSSPASNISEQVREIRQMVASLLTAGPATNAAKAVPAEFGEYYTRLLSQDVDESVAQSLLQDLGAQLTGAQRGDRALVRSELVSAIARRIGVAGDLPVTERHPGRARVVALIGPTGVGKTTTIAKLAANLKIRQHKRVALLTIDTYRIAAVDQLQTYADILDVPLRAVLTAGELHQAVQSMRDVDVILVDTAGRSHTDTPRLNQLGSFLAAAGADEVHLVISAAASRRAARNALAQFGPLGANRIILTKLDEAESCGMILNLSGNGGCALSYVTTGQDVPDDIETADAVVLAQRIAGN